MNDYGEIENVKTVQCMHPRVLYILEKFKVQSPAKIPKDEDQPSQGFLGRGDRFNNQDIARSPVRTVVKEAPVIQLNLTSSLFKNRRRSTNNS